MIRLAFLVFLLSISPLAAQDTVDGGEQCDGRALGGADCTTAGSYSGGIVYCDPGCSFNVTGCVP